MEVEIMSTYWVNEYLLYNDILTHVKNIFNIQYLL